MATFRGFATLNITADDVAAAARWYADVFGVEPYFERSGPDGRPRVHRVPPRRPAGRVLHRQRRVHAALGRPRWRDHALARRRPGGTVKRLLALGATEYLPIQVRGEGFVTASVVDPFGNVLGVMTNVHYLAMLGSDVHGAALAE